MKALQGPDLYRYLVAELDKLGLAYVHVMHQGDEPLLADIRTLWNGTLILNRPGRAREQIGADVASGLAESGGLRPDGAGQPRFRRTPEDQCADERRRPQHLLWRCAQGYTDYPALSPAAA